MKLPLKRGLKKRQHFEVLAKRGSKTFATDQGMLPGVAGPSVSFKAHWMPARIISW